MSKQDMLVTIVVCLICIILMAAGLVGGFLYVLEFFRHIFY